MRTTMDRSLGQEYFTQIRAIWRPFLDGQCIIPFCTPVFDRPTVLVIGRNHSSFAPRDSKAAAAIADRYAGIRTDNTFLVHSHSFATGLKHACTAAGITIDSTWMGTNRCAVQTDSKGIAPLHGRSDFAKCQRAMDDVLKSLVSAIR
jgi:hypothetical protein